MMVHKLDRKQSSIHECVSNCTIKNEVLKWMKNSKKLSIKRLGCVCISQVHKMIIIEESTGVQEKDCDGCDDE